MKFNTQEELTQKVDEIISHSVNHFLDEQRIREVFEKVGDAVTADKQFSISPIEFEKICQVSAAVVKGMAKHIVYATLESIHEINNAMEDN